MHFFANFDKFIYLKSVMIPTSNDNYIYIYIYTPHMAKQKQDDQLEHTYSSYVRIRDVALKTCQKQWMIGRCGERGSGISVLAAWHDDDDIYIYICKKRCPWCNGYRRRKWTRRHEFKSWTRLIAFHIALIPLGKVWIQLFSLQLWVK